MQRPKRLKRRDKIGIIAPASAPNKAALQASLSFLTKLGLQYELGKTTTSPYGYLSATDDERLQDVEEMFRRDDIAGIFCACGGYGAARYVDRLDFEMIRQHPKVFWGYSDITVLHQALMQYADLITFHGPMLGSDVGKETFHEKSAAQFTQLFEPTTLTYTNAFAPGLMTITPGIAKGRIVGGNLSLLASAVGTAYAPETAGNLLLIEDVDEEPYRVDAMLNQLRLAHLLDDVAGIIIADFANAAPKKRKATLSMQQVFTHYFGALGVPVVSGFKIGHCQPHFALPLGAEAILDATNQTLTMTPGVC